MEKEVFEKAAQLKSEIKIVTENLAILQIRMDHVRKVKETNSTLRQEVTYYDGYNNSIKLPYLDESDLLATVVLRTEKHLKKLEKEFAKL